MLSSSPQLIGHTTVQHVNDPNFINNSEPATAPVPPLTDDLNEDLGTSDSDNDSLPFLGEMTLPSISLHPPDHVLLMQHAAS